MVLDESKYCTIANLLNSPKNLDQISQYGKNEIKHVKCKADMINTTIKVVTKIQSAESTVQKRKFLRQELYAKEEATYKIFGRL